MRIAFVTSRFPFPVEKGDKLRAFHQIRVLSSRHEIHLISISHQKVTETQLQAMLPFCKSVRVFYVSKLLLPFHLILGWLEGMPLQVSYFLDRTIKRKVQYHIIRIEPDHIICQLIRAAPYVRALPFPKTLDYMDVFSEGMRQRAKQSWLGFLFKMESKRLAAFERSIYKDFDRHIIISGQDKERLNLASKEFIAVIPNGVDSTFRPIHDSQPKHDLVFIGNLGYKPNKDAVLFLVHHLMPVFEKRGKKINLLIAGARPGRLIRSLNKSGSITIKGWIDDIRDAYQDGRIFVAPMFSGHGLQNKILEAMAMGLPCITTSLVNNAIEAKSGDQILIADHESEMADHIEYLLAHPHEYERISRNAQAFVANHFTWEEHVWRMEEVMKSKNEYLPK